MRLPLLLADFTLGAKKLRDYILAGAPHDLGQVVLGHLLGPRPDVPIHEQRLDNERAARHLIREPVQRLESAAESIDLGLDPGGPPDVFQAPLGTRPEGRLDDSQDSRRPIDIAPTGALVTADTTLSGSKNSLGRGSYFTV